MQLDKPNFTLPLVLTENARGANAFTTTLTDGVDQRSINTYVHPYVNPFTGKGTNYLAKRPGVTLNGSTFGTSGQAAYLVCPAAQTAAAQVPWVFNVSGNNIRVSDSTGTTTIATIAGHVPIYVDRTLISGVDTVVLQTGVNVGGIRVWFSNSIGTWTEITPVGFPTVRGKIEHLDGYALALSSASQIHNSNLNSLGAWTQGDVITKQIQQDIPRGLMKFKGQILAMGLETMEVFVNAGNMTGSPLRTVPELQGRVGLNNQATTGQTHYYALCNERLYFFGHRSTSTGNGVFAWDGQRLEKVSTSAVDRILTGATEVYSINTVSFWGNEAIALGLDLPTATTQRWLMFYPEWKHWSEWTSTVFCPVNSTQLHLGVGSNQHRLYTFAGSNVFQDAGTNYAFTHQFQLPKNGSHRKFMPMFGAVGDTDRKSVV